jgi:cytochrome c556
VIRKTLLAAVVAAATFAFASEEAPPEHRKWMKDLGDQTGALRKGVEVEKNAGDMVAALKEVRQWWSKRTSDVALKTTDESITGAEKVVSAAKAGDKAGISEGMKGINAGCRGCHNVHREKVSETEYRIK